MLQAELRIAIIVLAALLGGMFWAAFGEKLTDPVPYKNVVVIVAEMDGDRFNLVADMQTTDCKFVKLTPVGSGLAGQHELTWFDNDGLGQNHERLQGDHTVRITVDTGGRDLDLIAIRTRHRCNFELDANGDAVGGELVDRVFMTFEVPE